VKLNPISLILGILNIAIGIFTATFIILMQNVLALVLGFLYIGFGVAVLNNKVLKKLLLAGIIPLSVLFSITMMMSSIDKSVPKYFQTPIALSLIIISVLLFVIIGDIYICKRKKSINP
jgi:low affinity Fe/Cu permease